MLRIGRLVAAAFPGPRRPFQRERADPLVTLLRIRAASSLRIHLASPASQKVRSTPKMNKIEILLKKAQEVTPPEIDSCQGLVADIVALLSQHASLEIPIPQLLHLLSISTVDIDRFSICSAISLRLESVPFAQVLTDFKPYLVQGLTSNDENLHMLALAQLQRAVESRVDLDALVSSFDIVPTPLFDCFKSEHARTAAALTLLLVKFCKFDFLELEPVKGYIQKLISSTSSTVQCRILESLIECSKTSARVLEVYATAFDMLFEWMYKSSDLLLQLNAIDLISKMATFESGFQLLESRGIVSHIQTTLTDKDSDALLVVLALKFLAHLSQSHPERVLSMSQILPFVVRQLESRDKELIDASVSFIGMLGSTDKGLMGIGSEVFNKFAQGYSSAHSQTRLEYMRAIASLFSSSNSPQATSILASLFSKLGGAGLIKDCIQKAKSAFSDERFAGLSALTGLAHHAFATTILMQSSNIAYVLDRTTETSYDGHVAKHLLVETILATLDRTGHAGDEGAVKKLREYVKRGPFYVEVAMSTVADMQ